MWAHEDFSQYHAIREFRRNSWPIFYGLSCLNAVQTHEERIAFYIRTLKHDTRGSSQFSPCSTMLLHRISPMQLKKRKKILLFVNIDVRNLGERTPLAMEGRGEGSDFFLKLYLLFHIIWLRVRISQAIIKCVFIAISGMYTYCEYCFQKLRKSWTTPELNCYTSKENWAVYNDFTRERSQGSVIIGLVW